MAKKKTTSKKSSSSAPKKKPAGGTSAARSSKAAASTAVKTAKKKPARSAKVAGAKGKNNGQSAKNPASSTAIRPLAMLDGQIQSNGHTPQLSDAEMRKVKTGLTKRELDHFQELLLEKRAEIVGDVASLDSTRAAAAAGDFSHMPLHMADVGSDNYEQEFTLGLVESEQKLLREIDEALGRIATKTYGVCIVSGKPIAKARLEVQPWARYCIEVARQRDGR